MTTTTDAVKRWFRTHPVATEDEIVAGLPFADPAEVRAVLFGLDLQGYLKENEDGEWYVCQPPPFPSEEMEILRSEGFNPEYIRAYCDRHHVDLFEAMDATRQYRSFVNQNWTGDE